MVIKGGGGAAASSSSSSAAAAMDASVSGSGGGGGGLLRSSTHSQAGLGAGANATSKAARDAWYTFDEAKLEEVMSAKAWMQE
jgi:hypothetical protein